MIDSIRFEVHAPLHDGANPASLKPEIRVTIDHAFGILKSVECSLPRLMFDHNGQLIQNQEQLDRAFALLHAKLDSIAFVPPIEEWVLKRLDLVWQFEGLQAGRVINAISAFRYPGIQKAPWHQVDCGVSWRGAGSRFVVTAYDKCRKSRVAGDILRIEVRFAGKALCRLRGRDWRIFNEMWEVYREVIGKLPDIYSFEDSLGLPVVIGRIVPHEYHEKIIADTKGCDRTKRLMRARIRCAAANLPRKLSWSELLPQIPPASPPIVIPRIRRSVRSRILDIRHHTFPIATA